MVYEMTEAQYRYIICKYLIKHTSYNRSSEGR